MTLTTFPHCIIRDAQSMIVSSSDKTQDCDKYTRIYYHILVITYYSIHCFSNSLWAKQESWAKIGGSSKSQSKHRLQICSEDSFRNILQVCISENWQDANKDDNIHLYAQRVVMYKQSKPTKI